MADPLPSSEPRAPFFARQGIALGVSALLAASVLLLLLPEYQLKATVLLPKERLAQKQGDAGLVLGKFISEPPQSLLSLGSCTSGQRPCLERHLTVEARSQGTLELSFRGADAEQVGRAARDSLDLILAKAPVWFGEHGGDTRVVELALPAVDLHRAPRILTMLGLLIAGVIAELWLALVASQRKRVASRPPRPRSAAGPDSQGRIPVAPSSSRMPIAPHVMDMGEATGDGSSIVLLSEQANPPRHWSPSAGVRSVLSEEPAHGPDSVPASVPEARSPSDRLGLRRPSSDPPPPSSSPRAEARAPAYGMKPRMADQAGRYSYSSRPPSRPQEESAPPRAQVPDGSYVELPSDKRSEVPRAPRAPSFAQTLDARGAPSPLRHEPVVPPSRRAEDPQTEPKTARGHAIPTPVPEMRGPDAWSEDTQVGAARMQAAQRTPSGRMVGPHKTTLKIGAEAAAGVGRLGQDAGAESASAPASERVGPPSERGLPASERPVSSRPTSSVSIRVEAGRSAYTVKGPSDSRLKPFFESLIAAFQGESRVILVAPSPSTGAEAAKSTIEVAVRLGHERGGSTVLVEADFERPQLAQLLRVEISAGRGLSEQLHEVTLGRASPSYVALNTGLGFHFFGEGRIRSPGLVWSQEFPVFVEALKKRYGLVLILAPDRMSEMDKRALDYVTDEVIVISRAAEGGFLGQGLLADKVTRTIRL